MMSMLLRLHAVVLRLLLSLPTPPRPAAGRRRDERGDVPGWVFVAVMSVGLVAALTQVAGPELSSLLRQAIRSVG